MPKEDKTQNILEIFNELSIIAINYHLFMLTDYVPNSDIQYQVGWSIIVFTTFNILANMIFTTVVSILRIKDKLKLKLTKLYLRLKAKSV